MGLFKNTAAFNKYVSPVTGSDSTAGDRNNPYQTITKALSVSNGILLNGKTNENITKSTGATITGDSEFSELAGVNVLSASNDGYANLTDLKANDVSFNGGSMVRCKITALHIFWGYQTMGNFYNNFIGDFDTAQLGTVNGNFSNNTIYNFINKLAPYNYLGIYAKNCIFINSVDLYNGYSRSNLTNIPIFKYCLFRKATIWKWNGVTISINYGAYGNVQGDYLSDVISGLYAFANSMVAGQDKNYFLAMIPSTNSSNIFYVDVNGQTCKVVEDRPSILGSKKIFNRYVGDNPVDYSLSLHADNVALIMSDELSYVGCYKANAKVLTFGAVMHVNADGSDDLVTVPDMLISDGNGKFHVSTADSVQTRNRVRSDVFNFKRGFNLTAFQSQIKSGLGSRFSMGKFQPYNITDAPTLPQESIEILPYDDENTPSVFPRFSGMFNGECQMWYHTTGAKINQPVLFNDLQSFFAITTDKSLAEYGTWAVTNADFETYLLSSKTGVALRNIPVYYGRIELNLNYHI